MRGASREGGKIFLSPACVPIFTSQSTPPVLSARDAMLDESNMLDRRMPGAVRTGTLNDHFPRVGRTKHHLDISCPGRGGAPQYLKAMTRTQDSANILHSISTTSDLAEFDLCSLRSAPVQLMASP